MGLRLLDGQISRYFPHALKADNRKAEVKQVLTPRRCNGGEKIILSFICDSRHMLPQQRPMKANQWWATCHRYASAPRFVRSLERIHQQIQAWQANAPTDEEVEATLDRYTGLAQQPVIVH